MKIRESAGEQEQLAVGDDSLAGVYAAVDNHVSFERAADRYETGFDGTVRFNHVDILALLPGLNRLGRNDGGVLAAVEREDHVHELARP
jgi:hypothetical protein